MIMHSQHGLDMADPPWAAASSRTHGVAHFGAPQDEDLTVPKFDAKKEGPAAAPAKEAGGRYAPTKACPLKSMAELTCQRCGLVNFANWAPDQALPKVSCQQCGASTIVSSFVPVYMGGMSGG